MSFARDEFDVSSLVPDLKNRKMNVHDHNCGWTDHGEGGFEIGYIHYDKIKRPNNRAPAGLVNKKQLDRRGVLGKFLGHRQRNGISAKRKTSVTDGERRYELDGCGPQNFVAQLLRPEINEGDSTVGRFIISSKAGYLDTALLPVC